MNIKIIEAVGDLGITEKSYIPIEKVAQTEFDFHEIQSHDKAIAWGYVPETININGQDYTYDAKVTKIFQKNGPDAIIWEAYRQDKDGVKTIKSIPLARPIYDQDKVGRGKGYQGQSRGKTPAESEAFQQARDAIREDVERLKSQSEGQSSMDPPMFASMGIREIKIAIPVTNEVSK